MTSPHFSLSPDLDDSFVSPSTHREMRSSLQQALDEIERGQQLSHEQLQEQLFDLDGVLCEWEDQLQSAMELEQQEAWKNLLKPGRQLSRRYQEQLK